MGVVKSKADKSNNYHNFPGALIRKGKQSEYKVVESLKDFIRAYIGTPSGMKGGYTLARRLMTKITKFAIPN